MAAAAAACPSHDAFEAYLNAASAHPSGFLGSLTSIAEKLVISVSAETRSFVIFRTGTFRGRRFVGACGSWVRLPSFDIPNLGGAAASVCRADGGAPHEQLALLCVVGFVLMRLSPGRCHRHGLCTLNALRSGRVWTALTSNLLHAEPVHLLHNLLQILHFGPVVHAALGCEHALQLLVASALASSLASVVWHGLMNRRRGEGSIGASGVAIALVSANAALFPRHTVSMYGLELSAAAVPFVYILLDALATRGQHGEVDVAAHAGGAAAGWALAQLRRAPRLWS